MKKISLTLTACLAGATAAGSASADTLRKIRDSGAITLGAREASGALAYTLGNGRYAGFHTEMSERIAADLQRQLGLAALEVNFHSLTSSNRIPLVINVTVDLECGSTADNEARQQSVAFAITTYVEEMRIAVRRGSGIDSLDDLAGRKAATTLGTTAVRTLRVHQRTQGVEIEQVHSRDPADSFLLLQTERVDAFGWTARSSPASSRARGTLGRSRSSASR
jgi:glutamate/aspartate transport system substrate-binding protein